MQIGAYFWKFWLLLCGVPHVIGGQDLQAVFEGDCTWASGMHLLHYVALDVQAHVGSLWYNMQPRKAAAVVPKETWKI